MSPGNIRFDFTGRAAIVTGAGRGIGMTIAAAFARAGARVAVSDVDGEAARRSLSEIEAEGGKGIAVAADVSDSGSVARLIRETDAAFGGIDILVNNAGIAHRGGVFSLSEEGWDRLMAVNLKGVWLCSREALPVMTRRTGGRIVNIGSISGWLGGHEVGADYAASKAGVAVLTKRLANETAARGVTVNSVAPHAIETQMTEDHGEEGKKRIVEKIPVKRLGTKQEVAAAVLFLASEEAGYITGQTLHVNGGTLMVF